jgi:hypothetical protein
MDTTKIKPRFNGVGARSGWSDFENKKDYFRIYGGVAWPRKGRPGFLVLLAEETRNLQSGAPAMFYGLTESEHKNDNGLLLKCVELAGIVDTWYSNMVPDAQRMILHQFNREQERKYHPPLLFLDVPMLSEGGDATQLFSYADAELERRTTAGQKTVFLGECRKVQAALLRVPDVWDTAEDILKLSEVTALFYVLGAMSHYPYSPPLRSPAKAITEDDLDEQGRYRPPISGACLTRSLDDPYRPPPIQPAQPPSTGPAFAIMEDDV